jgi:hypothetical protein
LGIVKISAHKKYAKVVRMGYDIAGLPVTFLFVNQPCQTYGFEIEVPAEILPDRHVEAGITLTRTSG